LDSGDATLGVFGFGRADPGGCRLAGLAGAAGVCGLFWGALYRFFPRHLLALVISHAAWDVAVFVLFPIGGS